MRVQQDNQEFIDVTIMAKTHEIKNRHYETLKSTFQYIETKKKTQNETSHTLILSNFMTLALNGSEKGLQFKGKLRKRKRSTVQLTTTFLNKNPDFQKQITQRQSMMLQAAQPFFYQSFSRQSMNPITRRSFNMPPDPVIQNNGIEFHLEVQPDSPQPNYSGNSDDIDDMNVDFQLDTLNLKKQPQFLQSKQFQQDPILEILRKTILIQKIFLDKKSQKSNYLTDTFTFGGSGAMYSCLDLNQFQITPFDFIECFEKMEKIKERHYKRKCQCPQILIYEDQVFDFYGLSFQLEALGFLSQSILEQDVILTQLNEQTKNQCCKGYNMIFYTLDKNIEEQKEYIEEIQQFNRSNGKEFALIACSQAPTEQERRLIKTMEFDDHLIKPILMDALCFVLARWIKL